MIINSMVKCHFNRFRIRIDISDKSSYIVSNANIRNNDNLMTMSLSFQR